MQAMQRYAHLLIILPVFLLDRWTKALVLENLAFREDSPVFSWLSIVHWHNTGGFFGLMADHGAGRIIFLFIPLVIIAGLLYYLIAYRGSLISRLSLTFVLAGALGNIYDRIFYGYVVDFIDIFVGSYHWPAFNIADSSITFGICLWLFTQFFLAKTAGKTRESKRTSRVAR
jgi:signal peptidase II